MNWPRLVGTFERLIATSFGSFNWNFLPALTLPACGSDGDSSSPFSWNVLWGAPVHKTCRPRKRTRMFSQFRLLKRHKNLVPCPKCATLHQLHTICGTLTILRMTRESLLNPFCPIGVCYTRVREQTEEIQQKLRAFNSTLGDSDGLTKSQTSNEQDDFIKPTTITENRPCKSDWYSKHLKETWHRVFDSK
ncbi:hypothetical protein D918_00171 [Trichuris suis]|nr:hypothetical protein D918_00171 [Trichuris suis]